MTQAEYMEILFLDCGFNITQKVAWLRLRFDKAYADELSVSQRSAAIKELKELKDSRSEPREEYDE